MTKKKKPARVPPARAGERTPPAERGDLLGAATTAAPSAGGGGGGTTSLGPWWDEDPNREQALELVYGGSSKKAIAKALGVHRNTVSNWCDAPPFQQALASLHGDRLGAMRARRAVHTNQLTDRVTALADSALKLAEKHAHDGEAVPVHLQLQARGWLAEFRALRAEERIDSGDNIQKHQHGHVVAGQIGVTATVSIKERSFKEFVHEHMNAIDVDAIDVTGEELIVGLVERVLSDTDVLDTIHEENREAQKLLAAGADR